MINAAALDEIRARHPVADVAARFGVTLRRQGGGLVGPCPACSDNSGSRSATRFEIRPDGQTWLCAVCSNGGDVIRLVQAVKDLDFRAAVDWLGGPPEVDPVVAARVQAEREKKRAERDRENDTFRKRELRRLRRTFDAAQPLAGTVAETYLRARAIPIGVDLEALRFLPQAAFFHGQEKGPDGKPVPRVIHRGPAIVAKHRRPDGTFGGLHLTYLADDGAGKATIVDPDTGEILDAKKVRGSKKGSHIPLIDPPAPERLYLGEGIETVLSVAQAYRDRRDTHAFWASLDLGNLGGPHADQAKHPTERTAHNHAKRVPGPTPAFDEPAIVLPDSVRELVILGDADSDPFLTRCAVERCAARYRRPGRRIVVAWPPSGADFNDLVRQFWGAA